MKVRRAKGLDCECAGYWIGIPVSLVSSLNRSWDLSYARKGNSGCQPRIHIDGACIPPPAVIAQVTVTGQMDCFLLIAPRKKGLTVKAYGVRRQLKMDWKIICTVPSTLLGSITARRRLRRPFHTSQRADGGRRKADWNRTLQQLPSSTLVPLKVTVLLFCISHP